MEPDTAGKFYNLSISPREGVTASQIEAKLDKAVDWFRYRKGSYLLYTKLSASTWYRRLGDFVKPGGQLFIAEIDISKRDGYMPRDFWDWLGKNAQRESSK